MCSRKCSSGQCELRQSERLGCGQSRNSLLQSGNPALKPQHDATCLDPYRPACTGKSHWIQIEPPLQVTHTEPTGNCDIMPLQPIGVQLVNIQTSPNDRLLWALDNRGSVFVRTGLSDEMPVGTDWDLAPGTSSCVQCLQIGTLCMFAHCVYIVYMCVFQA